MTAASMPACAQRRARRSAARSPSLIVIAGDDEARDAGRRREGAETSGGKRGRGGDGWDGGYQGQHGLDALADKERSDAVGGEIAEAHGEAVNTSERFARVSDARLGTRIQLHPLKALRDEPFG